MVNGGSIVFEKVTKKYGNFVALKELSFSIEAGERVVLLGPSGCGKTTALRIIAGLEKITSGQLFLNGRLANFIEPGERNVAMVFQNYALYPHMTVWENIAFGLESKGLSKIEINRRIKEALDMLGLEGLEKKKPRELSGGQRQRVALARAIVKQAPYFLLDEPLSNLDAQLRTHARTELVRLHEKVGSTMIYVTHDQIEAMTIGQRIAVLSKGVLQQFDTPKNVYNKPINTFVAKFIGNPPMNLIQVKIEENKMYINNDVRLILPHNWADLIAEQKTNELIFGIRPEDIILTEEKIIDGESFMAKIKWQEDVGNQKLYYLDIGGQEFVASLGINQSLPLTTNVWVIINWEKVHFFRNIDGMTIGYPWEQKNVPLLIR